MNTNPPSRLCRLALAAATVVALAACSKGSADAVPLTATASAPTSVAVAPAPAAPAPVSPTVVAQNNSAYDEGRRDQGRRDARNDRRDTSGGTNSQDVDHRRWSHDGQVAAAACQDCGVIESVEAVQVHGQTNGVGALAGGVGGAVVGNRIAGNHDRTIGGVVGAVGGGLIGNAIEKHERSSTVYDVHVRMSDGSLRTVRQATAPAVGERVRVEADGLHDRV